MGYTESVVDVKRLVTGFLVLATIVSSAAFVFLNFGTGGESSHLGVGSRPPAESAAGVLAIGKNAFVEPLPQPGALAQGATDAISDASDPTASPNLTERLAGTFAKELVAANPGGPRTIDGESSLLPPDSDAVINQLIKGGVHGAGAETLVEPIVIPEAAVLKNASKDDLLAYGDAFASIVEKNFLKNAAGLFPDGAPPSAEALNSAGTIVDSAYLEGSRLPVPEQAKEFHESFLAVLAYQKKTIALASETEDPLKAALAVEVYKEKTDRAFLKFESELERLRTVALAAPARTGFFASAEKLIGIEKAHAFLGIGDIVVDIKAFIDRINSTVIRIILETLKNRLIHTMVQNIISWIKGEGTPRFITNWKSLLVDTAKGAAANAAFKILPGVCSSFGPLVKTAFQPVPDLSARSPQTACTLDQIVSNIKAFHDSFESGGWVAYTTALQPKNNFFGSIIEISDIVARKSDTAQETKKAEGQANKGFLPTRICTAPKIYTKDQALQLYGVVTDKTTAKDFASTIGEDFISFDDKTFKTKTCPPDKWQTTTPGEAVGHTVATALDSPLHRIVNAEDITALIAALINSFLNKLVIGGDRGITGTSVGATSGATFKPPPDTEAGVLNATTQIIGDKQGALFMYQDLYNKASSTLASVAWMPPWCSANDSKHWFSNGLRYYCEVTDFLKLLAGGTQCNGTVVDGFQPRITLIENQISTLETFLDKVQATPATTTQSIWATANTQLTQSSCGAPPDTLYPVYYLTAACLQAPGWGGTAQQSAQLLQSAQDWTDTSILYFQRAKNLNCNDGGKPIAK